MYDKHTLGYGLHMGFLWACEQCRDFLLVGPGGSLDIVYGILVGWAMYIYIFIFGLWAFLE